MSVLKQILIKARRQVFSEMVGNNASRFKGEGYDFVELRQYQVGDDIKHIDWNITAKMQTPYIKVFKEERELNISLVSMMGGSLYFGANRLKQEVLSEVVALLGFSAIKNGDILSQYVVQEDITQVTKPSKRQISVHKGVDVVSNLKVLNQPANYKELGTMLMKKLRRKSLVIVVGDFFEIPNFKVLSKKHEVIAVIVRDTIEENPDAFGYASLIDPQSGVQLEGNFSKAKVSSFSQKVQQHDVALFEAFKKANVRYTKVYSDEVAYLKLSKLFGRL